MAAKKGFLKRDLHLVENQDIDDFYDQDSLCDFVNNDMISGEEGGFMLGYLGA